MTAKEYLMQIWDLDREIDIKCKALEQMRSQIGIRQQPDNQDRVVGSGYPQDQIPDIVIKIVTMEECLNRKIDKLIDLKAKILDQIDGMESRTYRNILMCRYVLMMNWDDVAESVGYAVQHCYRIHGRALQEFYRLYLKDESK